LNYSQSSERQSIMTTKRNGKRTHRPANSGKKQAPLTPADSLSILRSAVGYVMQAGLQVNAGTMDGVLVIKVTGAMVDDSGDTTRFVPAQASVPASGATQSLGGLYYLYEV
jgi:hypothetical protein